MTTRIETRWTLVVGHAWTPARVFLVVVAVWLLLLGVGGLMIDQTFPLGPSDAETSHSEHVLGIFETNGWHSLAGVLLGVIALYFSIRPSRARQAAFVIGVGHVGIVLALALWDPSTFLLASNPADQVVHSATAIGGLVSAALTRPRNEVRSPVPETA